jgi:hypothetical protein
MRLTFSLVSVKAKTCYFLPFLLAAMACFIFAFCLTILALRRLRFSMALY